jgi:hypothetical protein
MSVVVDTVTTGAQEQATGQPTEREQHADARTCQHGVQHLTDGERPVHRQLPSRHADYWG